MVKEVETPNTGLKEPWFVNRWRPTMAWVYTIICLCDFIIFPSVYSFFFYSGHDFHEWRPLTLMSGGLFHLAFGAILGVYAWQRSNEKMMYMGGGYGGGPYGGGYGGGGYYERTIDRANPYHSADPEMQSAMSNRAD